MNKFSVDFQEGVCKYLVVYEKIKSLIENNELEEGEKLPTIRALSEYLGINKITVINAYKKLSQEGYAYQSQGSGTYAKNKEVYRSFKQDYNEIFRKIASGDLKNWIDFTGETTSANFFQVEKLKKALDDVLERDGVEALIYSDPLGYLNLRKSINDEFWKGENNLDNILIISGAQQGIDIVGKSLVNVNDNIVVERPTYGGALLVFKLRKANILEIPMESDGPNIEKFELLLRSNKIKCFYTMSYFQNPTGISCSLEKKKRIIELAYKYDFYILEDDYLSELVYSDDLVYAPYRSLDSERVIYIKSFSKIFLPGIRMGYLIAPDKFKEEFQALKVNTDIATSSLMQRALQEYIDKGYWKEHIEILNREYSERYNYIKKLIHDKLGKMVSFQEPKGGLNIFLKINKNVDITSKELFYKLKDRQTIITPGNIFFKNPNDGDKSFRIGFSQIDYSKIERGIDNIHDVLKGR
ncbi:PLP-dependent aminotransferase family protein [Clostridium sp.]|uniref:aminotransferase-like domain-containing protein n=1 Tax=Clostridium sp. TaxID=1506 RepID=UPI0026139801|nr:PLP-dependent aminotransferase family protein [Clostridium sp.]